MYIDTHTLGVVGGGNKAGRDDEQAKQARCEKKTDVEIMNMEGKEGVV